MIPSSEARVASQEQTSKKFNLKNTNTMPITDGAKKALRVSRRKRVWNDARRKVAKESAKAVAKLVKDDKKADAKKMLSTAYKAIDKAAKRGVISKSAAARKKSKLSKLTK